MEPLIGTNTTPDEVPLTKWEIDAWVTGLAHTDYGRIRIISELIKHRVTDKMTDADYTICHRELRRLQNKVLNAIKKPKDDTA